MSSPAVSSVCIHHKSLTRKPRARKYDVTQAQREPPAAEPFEASYKPHALYIFYDLETTGLVEENVEIVNIAAEVDQVLLQQLRLHYPSEDSKEEDDDTDWWFESLVKPTVNKEIPKEVIDIHGIDDKQVAKAPSAKAVLTEMMNTWLPKLRAKYQLPRDFPILLVAHNNNRFDQVVLQWEMIRYKVVVPADVHFGDTYFTIKQAFGYSWCHSAFYSEQQVQLSLAALVKRICLREGFTQKHAAMNDVEALLDVMHAFGPRQHLYDALWGDRQAVYSHKQLTQIVEEEAARTQWRKNKSKNNNNNNNNSTQENKRNKENKAPEGNKRTRV